MSDDFVWTDRAIARLRALWDEMPRLSTTEIGRLMGLSKHSIVGKAHRLHLPSRPSPIREASASPRRKRGVGAQPRQATIPALPVLAAIVSEIPAGGADLSCSTRVAPSAPSPGRGKPCCFPIGDPGTKGFRMCDESAVRGAYCAAHADICFVQRPLKRKAAGPGSHIVGYALSRGASEAPLHPTPGSLDVAGRVTAAAPAGAACVDVSSRTSAGGSPPADFSEA